ncbi:RES family NAD+ phosphorylase [Microbacterium trichothecenolyticum]|uniref:RES domain-containing protein n=1 Tax=Microbacterium trichothecenolyticum TaxID=69370 RepID=A0ABU0TU31_MICTR|nr:RES family NAD+ phosphorylase [Microbacterium trichothecenolyticum]MDQ1123162.1 hypothetical protein [Microbacterium trichothecenolyticum]
MPSPRLANFPASAYRVGRAAGAIHFSEIDALDAELADVGNRFDVVGGGVMYCSSTRVGAFKEVLAHFRPAASSSAFAASTSEHLMAVGSVPASWRHARAVVEFSLQSPLPFLDVERDETLTLLTSALGEDLERLGIATLDSSNVRGPNRLLTRAIARWAYTQVDDNDEALYSGIRYSSRFQSHECWAVFAGVEIGSMSTTPIAHSDRDLETVSRAFGITVH